MALSSAALPSTSFRDTLPSIAPHRSKSCSFNQWPKSKPPLESLKTRTRFTVSRHVSQSNVSAKVSTAELVEALKPRSDDLPENGALAEGFGLGSERGGFASDRYEYALQIARKAVHLSSRLTEKVQEQLRRQENVATSKQDKSFVTVADWGVQAVVSWVLKEAFPEDEISMVAEEDTKDLTGEAGIAILQRVVAAVNECLAEAHLVGIKPPLRPLTAVEVLSAINRGSSQGGAVGRHWVLDPVDGTLGFVRNDQYAIALAMIEDGDLRIGVLGCPNLPMRAGWLRYPHKYHRIAEKLFGSGVNGDGSSSRSNGGGAGWVKGCVVMARRGGRGAQMEPLVRVGRGGEPGVGLDELGALAVPVRVSDVTDPANATFCEPVEKSNSNQGFTSGLASRLGLTNKPLRVYSMAKYAAISRGDAEIFMKFARASYKEKIWDHAAGVIVVEEAGGVVTDAGGAPLDFSKGRFLEGLDRGIICSSGPQMHRRILKAVDESWNSSLL